MAFQYGEQRDKDGNIIHEGSWSERSSPKVSIPIMVENFRVLRDESTSTTEGVATLKGNPPVALDTLEKIATSINNDGNFSGTVNTLIATKLDKTETSATAEANKLLYLDSTGKLPTDITGSAGKLNGKLDTDFAASSHTHLGTDITGNVPSATKLATARNINGVAFDGTKDITVEDSTKSPLGHTHNYAGSESPGGAATTALTCTGNSATASKLLTPVTINGVSFDGSNNISINDPTAMQYKGQYPAGTPFSSALPNTLYIIGEIATDMPNGAYQYGHLETIGTATKLLQRYTSHGTTGGMGQFTVWYRVSYGGDYSAWKQIAISDGTSIIAQDSERLGGKTLEEVTTDSIVNAIIFGGA